MAHGFTGKILHVDLTDGRHWVEEPDDTFYRKMMGGRALAAHYLLTLVPPGADPRAHPDDLDRLIREWLALVEARKPGELETRIRRYDGEYRWFLIRIVPQLDAEGNVVRWFGSNTRHRRSQKSGEETP